MLLSSSLSTSGSAKVQARRALWIWTFLANCLAKTLWWRSTLPFSTNMIKIHHGPQVEHIPFFAWCHVTHVFRRKPTVACDLLQIELMYCISFSYTQVKAIPMLMTKPFVACAYCLHPPWFTIVVTTVLVIVGAAAAAAVVIIGSIILSIFIGMFDSQSLSRHVLPLLPWNHEGGSSKQVRPSVPASHCQLVAESLS